MSHLIAKHGIEALEGVVTAIARGEASPHPTQKNRIHVEENGYRAVLDRFGDGQNETWLLTSFEIGIPSEKDIRTNLKELTGPIFFGKEEPR